MYYLPYKNGKWEKLDLFSDGCKWSFKRIIIKGPVEKFLHLREKVVENSRLAPQFLPSPRPNLPAITDSPEGGANLLVGGANLLVTAVPLLQNSTPDRSRTEIVDLE